MKDSEHLLEVRGVSFVRQQTLLAPVSFTLDKGEFVWLTGPSGAGKSTLLKIISSLLEPSSGDVYFHGQSLATLQPEQYRQQVSYVFQTPVLFGHTVWDNLAFPYQIRQQVPKRQVMIDSLQRLHLPAETLDRRIEQLSGGEKQRVALLRNLQFPPEILLLDEITSALDQHNREAVHQLIDEQVAKGTAAIWISHDNQETSDARRKVVLSVPEQRGQNGAA